MSSFLQVKLPWGGSAGALLQNNATALRGFGSQLLEIAKGISGEVDSTIVIRTALIGIVLWVNPSERNGLYLPD